MVSAAKISATLVSVASIAKGCAVSSVRSACASNDSMGAGTGCSAVWGIVNAPVMRRSIGIADCFTEVF